MKVRRQWVALSLVVLVAVALPGCDMAKAGARCRPNGAWGRTSTHVLHCEKGRWRNTGLTLQRAAEIILSSRPTTPTTPTTPDAPQGYVAVAHTTVYSGEVAYDDDSLADPVEFDEHDLFLTVAPGAAACSYQDDPPPVPHLDFDRVDDETIEVEITWNWVEDQRGTGAFGKLECGVTPTLTVDLLDDEDDVTATATLALDSST